MKEDIQAKFIDIGETKPNAGELEVVEIDGLQEKGKQFVGALGGVLGQIIITLSAMEANFNRRKTTASSRSGRSRRSGASNDRKSNKTSDKEKEDAKSHKSGVSGKSSMRGISEDGKSEGVQEEEKEPAEKDYTVEPEYTEKGWFTRANIQNFLYTYIQEKLRTPKMELMVGFSYEKFISSLP